MEDLVCLDYNTYSPDSLNTWKTLSMQEEGGHFRFKIDKSNLPPGTIVSISFQERLGPDQPFLEFETAILSVPVEIIPPPGRGHLPISTYEFSVLFGLKIEAQINSGKLPERGLYWSLIKTF